MRLILRIISDTDVPDIESPERNVHIKIKQKKVERVENKSTFYLVLLLAKKSIEK